MEQTNQIGGEFLVRDARFAIVASRFNSYIVDHLLKGALDALIRHGAREQDVDVVHVPGAYEIPLAIQRVIATEKYDAVIALGCVIRGSTPHFDQVANACSMGIAKIALEHDIPIGFGILTVETIEQAIERAGTKDGNKGRDAAASAIEMTNLMAQIK
jgi:6,7-dimethyl-8-ribityllumazine synthase